MVQAVLSAMVATRPSHPYQGALLELLRQAGYADGERRPRHGAYWANR